jgi:hypothetical protein
MSYTLGQAAKATGMSKSSILRAIKNHKISATKDEASGVWLIEPAELHRLYPPIVAEQSNVFDLASGEAPGEIRELRVKLEAAQQRLSDKDAEIGRQEKQIDQLNMTLRQFTALLTDQREKPIITPPEARERANDLPHPTTKARRWWQRGKRESV